MTRPRHGSGVPKNGRLTRKDWVIRIVVLVILSSFVATAVLALYR
jgi:hypothetical protein